MPECWRQIHHSMGKEWAIWGKVHHDHTIWGALLAWARKKTMSQVGEEARLVTCKTWRDDNQVETCTQGMALCTLTQTHKFSPSKQQFRAKLALCIWGQSDQFECHRCNFLSDSHGKIGRDSLSPEACHPMCESCFVSPGSDTIIVLTHNLIDLGTCVNNHFGPTRAIGKEN